MIVDVHVDGKSQFPQAGMIPGEAFHPDALDCLAAFDVVPAGGSFAIKAHYVGSNPRGGRFRAIVRGQDGVSISASATVSADAILSMHPTDLDRQRIAPSPERVISTMGTGDEGGWIVNNIKIG